MNTGLFISQYVKNARRNDADYLYASFIQHVIEGADSIPGDDASFSPGDKFYNPRLHTTMKVRSVQGSTMIVRNLRWYEKAWDWVVQRLSKRDVWGGVDGEHRNSFNQEKI